MSRSSAPRTLTLTEELEKLEQSITLTLQEIDKNFSTAHRIVTTSILPIVEDYAKHSSDVWDGSKFWKQFFEASANVSLSGYEEAALEEDVTNTETTSNDVQTPTDHDGYAHSGALDQDGAEEEFSVDSPTQVTGLQTTPKLSSTKKQTSGRAALAKTVADLRSPSPRKYTGQNPRALDQSAAEPSTPRPQKESTSQSSPFEPESAYQPSAQQRRTNNDPLMHRVLDKNYRVQATPHTQRSQRPQPTTTATKPTPATTTTKATPWDDSPQSSPAVAAPQLRSDLFSPLKQAPPPRTPGISVLTPAPSKSTTSHHPAAAPTTSTGRRLFSPQDKTYTATKSTSHPFSSPAGAEEAEAEAVEDYEDSSLLFDAMSPPKTMQFHIPQSRLLQTPAREASKKIVEDLLLTAGADGTEEIEADEDGFDGGEEVSPSVVRRAWEEDSF